VAIASAATQLARRLDVVLRLAAAPPENQTVFEAGSLHSVYPKADVNADPTFDCVAIACDRLAWRADLTSDGAPEKMREAQPNCADVAELADALDSGSSSRKGVEVQVLSSAPMFSIRYRHSKLLCWQSLPDCNC
jgi:hypothetical protein